MFVSIYTQAQSSTCANASPLCASEELVYENTHDGSAAESGPNYGCLGTQPNPGWFYLQIGASGSVELEISQSSTPDGAPDSDVDFIIWGPFSDLNNVCDNLTTNNIIDCSFSIDPIEDVDIPNAIAGEYYILLITNYAGDFGYISVKQTNLADPNAGTTNCDIVTGNTYYQCEDDGNEIAEFDLDTIMLDVVGGDASLNPTAHLTIEDAENNQNPLASPFTNTANPTVLYIRQDNPMGGFLITEIQLIVADIPEVVSHTLFKCDTNGDLSEEFNLETALPFMVGDTNGLNISFHASQAEAETNSNAFTTLTNYMVSTQTTIVYVRVQDPISGCYNVQPLTLELSTIPSVQNTNLTTCVDVGETEASFDLTSAESAISNVAGVTYTYYATQADANAGNTNTIANPTDYVSGNATVYVVVTDGACSAIAELEL
ncbi:MAG: hypothetical protein CSA38_05320, partial [Flavobacteriales bacterium]